MTYAHKIEARDRALDHTRPAEEVERVVRALRPHIGARLPLPDGSYLGVVAAEVDGETLAPAGGRVRAEGERLLLDCNGRALELLEVQPPGGRRMAAADWLRGRPDPALVNFWLDQRLPERSLDELVELAINEWRSDAEWPPYMAALAWRGDEEVLAAVHKLSPARGPARPRRRRLRARPARRARAHVPRGERRGAGGARGARGGPGGAGDDRERVRPPRGAARDRDAAAAAPPRRRARPRRRGRRARRPRRRARRSRR